MLTLDQFYSVHYVDPDAGVSIDYFPGGQVLLSYDDNRWKISAGRVIVQHDLLVDSVGPDTITVIPASNSVPRKISWHKFYTFLLPLIKSGKLRII